MQAELQMITDMENDNKYLISNYDKLREKYTNRFVAIKNGEVVADGKTIEEIIKKLEVQKIDPATTLIDFIREKGLILVL